MALVRLACLRTVQLLGNFLKVLFKLDFLLRPKKRYTIPAVAAPLLRPSTSKKIPRTIWITNYTRDVTLSIYVNYLFNRMMAPTFEFRLFGDDDCERFIKETFSPEIHACYSRLQIGAAMADLWRILVLLDRGGIYMDIDAALSWPPEAFLSADQTELFVRTKDGKLTNYFLASIPGHPIIKSIADKIVENISSGTITSVYDMTGPTVVNEVAGTAAVQIQPNELVCRQGQFTTKSLQYPDNKKGYWVLEQERKEVLKR